MTETDTLEQALVRFPVTFFQEESIREGSPLRMIIEGGISGDLDSHHVDPRECILPQDVKSIRIGPYTFKLVVHFPPQGDGKILNQINQVRACTELEYDLAIILKPTTLLAADGRLYHDSVLLSAQTGCNSRRLRSFIESITKDYKTFSEAYMGPK